MNGAGADLTFPPSEIRAPLFPPKNSQGSERMQRRTFHGALIGALLIAVAGGGFWYRQHHRYKHWAAHDPGMVYRSAWMDADVIAEQIERYQIRSVVNLCQPGEMGEARWDAEREAVTSAGARLIELPMPFEIDPGDPLIQQHVDLFSNPDNYPVLVHCQHGVTRTAKSLAIYDMVFRGMSADQSLESMPLFGRDDHNVNIRSFAKLFEETSAPAHRTAAAGRLDILIR